MKIWILSTGRILVNKRELLLNKQCGFTLLELLIVLVIIGLVSVLVLPRIGGNLNSLKLKAETKKLSALLRRARNEAISENTTIRVKFDNNAERLMIVADMDKTESVFPWNVPADTENEPVVRHEMRVADDIELRFRDGAMPYGQIPEEIVFYPSGRSNGGTLVLKIAEKQFRIIIDDVSGTVKVMEDKEIAFG